MTPRKRKLWRESAGGYGHTVTACERRGVPNLYLTWRDRDGRKVWQTLGHADRARAAQAARELSGSLLAASAAKRDATATVAMVFAVWEAERAPRRRRPREERRRLDMWQGELGGDRDVYTIGRAQLDRFAERREKTVSRYTAGRDIAWLKTVLNWAAETELLRYSPIAHYRLKGFRQLNPRRPIATDDRFDAVLQHAGAVNPRFPTMLRFACALGWRVTALCELQASDFDPRPAAAAPHGRVLKRAESDKQGVQRWTPMSITVRTAFDDHMQAFPAIGDVLLFPAPRAKGKAWTRYYARSLLRRAERAAGLPDSSGFHAYRRAWVTKRKHWPPADVAAAGAWLSVRTLEIYAQPDAETMYAVVSEQRQLREAK